MILYTTMPQELIFQSEDNTNMSQSTIEMNGLSLVVEQISSQQCRVVQLLSTNPNDYLNASYQPGAILSLKPYF
ncbi:YlzJ-like family protein [Bacillus sp. Marseille-P3661]|uniref:YlzJ-like family protein n=1 Tax=Bacillus sp. Marseille-P3661 TaxID=1936234 RepID=UPI000C82E7F2|nr:YlzJ-like family protein [Bacillus sp. Marseille-P3661]